MRENPFSVDKYTLSSTSHGNQLGIVWRLPALANCQRLVGSIEQNKWGTVCYSIRVGRQPDIPHGGLKAEKFMDGGVLAPLPGGQVADFQWQVESLVIASRILAHRWRVSAHRLHFQSQHIGDTYILTRLNPLTNGIQDRSPVATDSPR